MTSHRPDRAELARLVAFLRAEAGVHEAMADQLEGLGVSVISTHVADRKRALAASYRVVADDLDPERWEEQGVR